MQRYRRNSDSRLRDLARRYHAGDYEAGRALLTSMLRTRSFSAGFLQLLGMCDLGHNEMPRFSLHFQTDNDTYPPPGDDNADAETSRIYQRQQQELENDRIEFLRTITEPKYLLRLSIKMLDELRKDIFSHKLIKGIFKRPKLTRASFTQSSINKVKKHWLSANKYNQKIIEAIHYLRDIGPKNTPNNIDLIKWHVFFDRWAGWVHDEGLIDTYVEDNDELWNAKSSLGRAINNLTVAFEIIFLTFRIAVNGRRGIRGLAKPIQERDVPFLYGIRDNIGHCAPWHFYTDHAPSNSQRHHRFFLPNSQQPDWAVAFSNVIIAAFFSLSHFNDISTRQKVKRDTSSSDMLDNLDEALSKRRQHLENTLPRLKLLEEESEELETQVIELEDQRLTLIYDIEDALDTDPDDDPLVQAFNAAVDNLADRITPLSQRSEEVEHEIETILQADKTYRQLERDQETAEIAVSEAFEAFWFNLLATHEQQFWPFFCKAVTEETIDYVAGLV